MVNFGPLAAEIVSLVWGTPGNFNGFRVLAALLHAAINCLPSGINIMAEGRPFPPEMFAPTGLTPPDGSES